MLEQFSQERARMIAESEARLEAVRWQAEDERAHYINQGQMREAEIQRVRRVLQQADHNAAVLFKKKVCPFCWESGVFHSPTQGMYLLDFTIERQSSHL